VGEVSGGSEFAIRTIELNLRSFRRLIGVIEGQARAAGDSELGVFEARLAPDMLPFGRQVTLAAYFACAAVDRLNGDEPRPPEEITLEFAGAAAILDAAIDRVSQSRARSASWRPHIVQAVAGELRTFTRDAYLAEYALPSFMFHWITGYGILRNRGYAIGKKDFLNLVAAS